MDRKKKSLMDLTPQLFNNSVERFLRGFDFQEARTSIERLNVTSKIVTNYIKPRALKQGGNLHELRQQITNCKRC